MSIRAFVQSWGLGCYRVACGLLAGALVVLPVTSSAAAGESGVALGEVSSRVARDGVDFEGLVRAASLEELGALHLEAHVEPGATPRRVIVSVALVRLDTSAAGRVTDARCKVSATLRNARSGALFAVVDGQARASGGEAREEVERSAMHGALQSAFGRLPEVLAPRVRGR
jgi:hypothetical protein